MSKLIILQGAPGAGKSTMARKLHARSPKDTVIVSKDSLREGRGTYWLPSQEPYITELQEFAIMRGLERQYNVIVDSVNLEDSVVDRLIQIGTKCQANVEIMTILTPMDECIKRDKNKNKRHPVGSKVIERYFNEYHSKLVPQEPDIEEEDEIDEISDADTMYYGL